MAERKESMAISSFEINGMMGRTQDFSVIKHQEDNKASVAQSVFQNQSDKQVQNKAQSVQSSQKSETNQQKKDAREKGSNEYAGDGGSRRRNANGNMPVDGKVVKKDSSTSHFECRI